MYICSIQTEYVPRPKPEHMFMHEILCAQNDETQGLWRVKVRAGTPVSARCPSSASHHAQFVGSGGCVLDKQHLDSVEYPFGEPDSNHPEITLSYIWSPLGLLFLFWQWKTLLNVLLCFCLSHKSAQQQAVTWDTKTITGLNPGMLTLANLTQHDTSFLQRFLDGFVNFHV